MEPSLAKHPCVTTAAPTTSAPTDWLHLPPGFLISGPQPDSPLFQILRPLLGGP